MTRKSVVTTSIAWGVLGIAVVSFWYELARLTESYLRAALL